MEHREKAIKCSGKHCKEVFLIYENYEPGGINDRGYIAMKCKKCGALTKLRMKNPSKNGIFDKFEIVDAWEDGDESPYESLPDGETALVIRQNNDINLEVMAGEYFKRIESLVDKEIKGLYNVWVKSMPGFDDVERCIVTQEYESGGRIYMTKWGRN